MATSIAPAIFKNYINGEWVESRSGRVIENRNPADTSELVGLFPASSEEDVAAAVDAAKAAYDKWRLTPAPKRAEILFRAAEILVERKEEYAVQMTREMGKVLAETRGDVQEAIDMTYLMAGEGRRLFGQTTPSELPNKFAMSVRAPVGVAGLITPWNFPMAIPSWKAMPALICGNTVVLKPAEDTPLSTYNLAQVLEEAGLPPGVLNVVFGEGPDAGAPMLENPDVNLVSFTGSTEVGRIVSQACAPTFKKCHLEMGGKNIIIVMDDANLDLAVEGAHLGRIRHHRPALHGREPHRGAQECLSRVQREIRGAREKAEGRRRPGNLHRYGAVHQRAAAQDGDEVRADRNRRRRKARNRRPPAGQGPLREGLVPRADRFCRLRSGDAHLPGGDFRAGGRAHPPVRHSG